MAFTYKVWLSPAVYECLYAEMAARELGSVKETIKQLALTADDKTSERALVLAMKREEMRGE